MQYLARFGGKDGRIMARTIAQFIVDDTVYAFYSWNGPVKDKFSKFKEINNTILGAIRSKHSTFTMDELAEFYQDHLRWARMRLKRKRVI